MQSEVWLCKSEMQQAGQESSLNTAAIRAPNLSVADAWSFDLHWCMTDLSATALAGALLHGVGSHLKPLHAKFSSKQDKHQDCVLAFLR